MFDMIKKGMLTGIGLALKTWDEVEDFVNDMQEKGEVSEKEGRKFLDEARQRYDETQEKLEKRIETTVRNFLKKTQIVTTDELKELKKEIRELKGIVNSLTQKEE
jgi:polyhydroxyalkanoate synthesis regulator phasin